MEWQRNWERTYSLRARTFGLRLLLMLPALAIFGRLIQLQVIERDDLWERGEAQQIRQAPVHAVRGEIHDRNQFPVVSNAPLYQLWADQRITTRPQELELLLDTLQIDKSSLTDVFNENRARRIGKKTLLVDNLDSKKAAKLLVFEQQLEYLHVQTTFQRQYDDDRAFAHILGYIGEASSNDAAKGIDRDFGDRVGRRGIEKIYDETMFGTNGEQILRVDAQGYPLANIFDNPPVHGRNITLTIDWDLQKFAFQLLEGETGSIVAIEPYTGEILAAVSSPSMALNDFRFRVATNDWKSLVKNPEKPLLNRSFSGQYPPGSTYKPIVALAGLQEGKITPNEKIHCNGGYQLGRRRFRCWSRYGHGKVDLHRALRESCDVYFYTLALRLGPDLISQYANMFGLGMRTNAQVQFEKPGLVPTPEYKLQKHKDKWRDGNTLSMSIGQGYNLATPAQIARLYGALGTGRSYDLSFFDQATTGQTIDISPENFAIVRKALRAVVHEPGGTARRARVRGIEVAGKTGTAQVVSNVNRNIREELIPRKSRDHAWFAAWAPIQDPQIAVAVIVEHGLHGGSTAAPLAQQVMDYYINTVQQ